MKNIDSLLVPIFSCILAGILAIYGLILHRVNTIENYLQIHDGVKVTDEFKFMVDFAQGNIEIFIWYSTLLFAAVAIASAFLLRLQFDRSVETVRSDFIAFKNEARDNYNGHELELITLRRKINVNLSTFTEHTAFLNTRSGDIAGAALLYLWTVLYSIRAEEHLINEEAFKDFFRRNLHNANESIEECRKKGIKLPEITLSTKDEYKMIEACPKELLNELRNVLNKLNRK